MGASRLDHDRGTDDGTGLMVRRLRQRCFVLTSPRLIGNHSGGPIVDRTWVCQNGGVRVAAGTLMKSFLILLAAGMIAVSHAAYAQAPSPGEIVTQAPADAWADIPDADLLTMALVDGRTVTIQLVRGFAPVHVANIEALAAAHWFDGVSVNRVQENYVVQWGDASEQKPLPPGLGVAPAGDYDRPLAGLGFRPLGFPDAYAPKTGHAGGWPIATDGARAWLPHCFGMVGVGRNLAPDTGTGAELYVVNGHAPRHLDRNIALVGRVIDGIEALTSLPRGTGALGFYEQPGARVAIASVRKGSLKRWQVLNTDSAAFAAYADARANRRDSFFIRPAGGADICNVPVPVRAVP